MKSGRNDSCPCGSGKKYKKCCLLKDQAAEQRELSRSEVERLESAVTELARTDASRISEPNRVSSSASCIQPPRPATPPDPLMDAINARWEEFEATTDDEGRRNLFVKTLDEPELMDDEMAFEMLSSLFDGAVESGERDQFEDLLDQLRERLPDVYATGRKYYLNWKIVNAVASRRPERVLGLAREMAEIAGEEVDLYAQMVDLLAYHGMLRELGEASRIAWPLINDADDIMWGQEVFARWGADCLLFERMERMEEVDGRDPELIEQTRFYFEDLRVKLFADYVSHLSGRANRTWSLSDFQKPPSKGRKKTREQNSDDEDPVRKRPAKDDEQEALASLCDEFVDYARRREGVSYTKAALARDNITRYILDRQAGELVPRQSPFEAMTNPQPKPIPRVPDHYLCPDRETLDRFFAILLHFMNPQIYDVAATFELIPAWLRFLETRGLIAPAQREATLADLRGLHPTLLKLWEGDRADPMLAENLQTWNETIATTGSLSRIAPIAAMR